MASEATRRTLRTVLQTGLSLAAGLPFIVEASGIPQTSGVVVGTLAVAAGITRVMQLDVVDAILPSWLRRAAREEGRE